MTIPPPDIDKRMERAARQNSPFIDLRLSRDEVARLDKALRLLREQEASQVERPLPPAIESAIRESLRTGRL